MSLPGRPKGEYRSAKHGGCLMSLPGRPKGEYRSAKHGGCLMSRAAATLHPASRSSNACLALRRHTDVELRRAAAPSHETR